MKIYIALFSGSFGVVFYRLMVVAGLFDPPSFEKRDVLIDLALMCAMLIGVIVSAFREDPRRSV